MPRVVHDAIEGLGHQQQTLPWTLRNGNVTAGLVEEGALYCQLDSIRAMHEYGEGLCTRFIGVSRNEFNIESLSGGVTTYTIDVSDVQLLAHFCEQPDDCELCYPDLGAWFRIMFEVDPAGASHVYQNFSEADSMRVRVTNISHVPGIEMPALQAYTPSFDPGGHFDWRCYSFEVGQGMATAVHCRDYAYLFDAGAGKPIQRPDYLSGNIKRNDLLALIQTRRTQFFLSHPDSDHWRLLSWDSALRTHIESYVVPHGRRPLGVFDKAIKHLVQECSAHISLNLGQLQRLDILRTNPGRKTSNNDGLIGVFKSIEGDVLIPGDCVYTDMSCDQDQVVSALVNRTYRAVVVPHHGDAASANGVPKPSGRSPLAFFSAGNHSGYQHPRACSVDAHVYRGFKKLISGNYHGIVEVRLV